MKAPPSPIRPSNDASSSPALPVQPASKSGTTTNLAKKDLNTSTPLQKEHEPERMQKEEAKSGVEVIDFTGWSETAAVVQTPAPLAHVGRVEPTPPTQPKDGSVLPPQATDESTPTPVSLARTLDFPVESSIVVPVARLVPDAAILPKATAAETKIAAPKNPTATAAETKITAPIMSVPSPHGGARHVGRLFEKFFPGHGTFKGTVVEFRTDENLWLVKYEDGDAEELDKGHLLEVMCVKSKDREDGPAPTLAASSSPKKHAHAATTTSTSVTKAANVILSTSSASLSTETKPAKKTKTKQSQLSAFFGKRS